MMTLISAPRSGVQQPALSRLVCRSSSSPQQLWSRRLFSSSNTTHDENKPSPKIGRLILVRHGQSVWNVTDPTSTPPTVARFTGWADIGLTPKGEQQAKAAGKALFDRIMHGKCCVPPTIDCCLTSLLKRSKDTATIILDEMQLLRQEQQQQANTTMTMISSWRLNERHYGSLVGLSKAEAEAEYNHDLLSSWRCGWNVRPPPMNKEQQLEWAKKKHCQQITEIRRISGSNDDGKSYTIREKGSVYKNMKPYVPLYASSKKKKQARGLMPNSLTQPLIKPKSRHQTQIQDRVTRMPASESLKDTFDRVLPMWMNVLVPRLKKGETILLVAHSNTVKALLRFMDGSSTVFHNDDNNDDKNDHENNTDNDNDINNTAQFHKLKIPSAVPLCYQFRPQHHNDKYHYIDGTNEDDGSDEIDASEDNPILPGGLVLIKPPPVVETEIVERELRYHLNGEWIHTPEIDAHSFCSKIGEKSLESEIA